MPLPKNYETFNMPAESMAPSLRMGEYLYTTYDIDEIKRGDIVVFKYPNDMRVNYVKRVIGLPGDTIEIVNKVVYINGQPLLTTANPNVDAKTILHEKFHGFRMKFYDTQIDDKKFQIILNPENNYTSSFPKTTVPAGNVFVLGDNRDFSSDSRFWGFVPMKNIFAKPKFIYFTPMKSFFNRFGSNVE